MSQKQRGSQESYESIQSDQDTPKNNTHGRSKTQGDYMLKRDTNQSILITTHSRSSKRGFNLVAPMYSSNQLKQSEQTFFEDKKQKGNTYSSLMRFFHIKKFISNITRRKRLNQFFSQYHFEVLNDKGAFFDLKFFQNSMLQIKPLVQQNLQTQSKYQIQHIQGLVQLFKKKILSTFNKLTTTLLDRIPIFYPEAPASIVWDFLVTLSIVYFMIFLPLDLATNQKEFLFENWFSEIMIILQILHIIVSLNTAFYEKGSIVSNRALIVNHVLGKFYGLELITIISLVILWMYKSKNPSYQFSFQQHPYQIFYMLFLLQYQNVVGFIKQISEGYSLSKQQGSLVELFKLIISIFYMLHIFTCLWFWAGQTSASLNEPNWLQEKDILTIDWSNQYLYSLYFSTVTMFTVGYGDITPQSFFFFFQISQKLQGNLERIISIIFMIFASFQLSYSVNTVGTIIDEITRNEELKSKNLQIINSYMQNKKISYQLQYQIREYLNYFWSSEKAETCRLETEIINQLSVSLRDKLKAEANKMMFNECILFKHYFSDQLKNYLIHKVIPVVVQPESIVDYSALIGSRDCQDKIFLCFIEEGQLDVVVENDANIYSYTAEVSTLQKKSEGETLGLISFITGEKSSEKLRSNEFSKILLLSRDDFIKTLKDFPEDQEVFYTISEQLKFQTNSDVVRKLKIQCSSCKSVSHREINCPILHFVPDQELLIKKKQNTKIQARNCFRKDQKRQFYVRTPQIKNQFYDARLDQYQMEEIAQVFQKENSNYIQFYELFDKSIINIESPIQASQELIMGSFPSPTALQYRPEIIIPNKKEQEKSENSQPNSPKFPRRISVSRQKDDLFYKKIDLQLKQNYLDVRDQILEQSSQESIEQSEQEISDQSQELVKSNIPSKTNLYTDKIRKSFFLDEIKGLKQKDKPNFSKLQLAPIQQKSLDNITEKPEQTTDQQIHSSPSLDTLNPEKRLFQTIKVATKVHNIKKNFRSNPKKFTFRGKDVKTAEFLEINQINEQAMYEVLNNRLRLLEPTKANLPPILLKAYEEGEFMLIKLGMMIQKDKLDHKFETLKNYKYYFPENNIDKVILKQKTFYDMNKLILNNLHDIYYKLVKYLMYPYIYIEKYKFQYIDKQIIDMGIIRMRNKHFQQLQIVKSKTRKSYQSKRQVVSSRKKQSTRPYSDVVKGFFRQ